ncbi:MAG TPA: hypothetical protein VHK22_09340, partial [Gaiellaceae bacterium]|nr:hypothetical protein [Gaiellaceae bacterium]
ARPEAQRDFNARWRHLNCGDWRPGDAEELRRLGVRSILLHRGLYDFLGAPEEAERAGLGLGASGWIAARTDGRITLFAPGEPTGAPPPSGAGRCEL